jgi:hypothetical protein
MELALHPFYIFIESGFSTVVGRLPNHLRLII